MLQVHPFKIQKQECTLVCRQWSVIIRSYCLLNTIYLPCDEKIHNKFFRKMEHQPTLCKQVEYLRLPGYIGPDYNRSRALYLFPNLKTIETSRQRVSRGCRINTRLEISSTLQGQIKHIEDIHPFDLTRLVLTSGMGSGLTTLILHDRMNGGAYNEILSFLDTAPLLNYLSLRYIFISTETCEMIHNSLPLLKSFHLLDCHLVKSPAPTHISPAMTVVALVIKTMAINEHFHPEWPQYISLKYPKLEYLDYGSCYYNTNVAYIDMLNELGYPVILKNIGLRLRSLKLACIHQDNSAIFKMLDYYKCQTNHLCLYNVGELNFNEFSQLELSKYIETLSLYDVTTLSNMHFKNVESLTSLEIHFENKDDYYAQMPTISLNKIFKSLSKTIESLTIVSTNAYIYTDEICQQFSIKKLTLSGIELSLSETQFIANCFPELHALKINLFYYGGLTLKFPNHHFSLLDLGFISSGYGLALITRNDNQTRYFHLKAFASSCTDYSLLGSGIIPVPKETFGDTSFITVLCGSLKTLYLNDVPAYF
ncbi:hypothetical protein K501DRAFT_272663 [Backusella circina FSU 941]|nr:hypothetical protein K501DRAFT_272663 [Backusella circina FSU 941]